MIKRSIPILLLATLGMVSCATGEDKNEGTTGHEGSSVGTSFERDASSPASQTTTTPGDTAGVNTTPTTNDQVGPTGNVEGGSQ